MLKNRFESILYFTKKHLLIILLIIFVFLYTSSIAFASLTFSSSGITSSANLIITPTGGTASFTGQLLAPVGNCTTTPPYSFTGRATTGLASNVADTWSLCGGGTLTLSGNTSGILSTNVSGATPGTIVWSDGGITTTSRDIVYIDDTSTATRFSGSHVQLRLNPSASASGRKTAFASYAETLPANAQNFTSSVRGAYLAAEHWGSGTIGELSGAVGEAYNSSSGNITEMYGGIFAAHQFSASGTATTAVGVSAYTELSGSGPITNGYGGMFQVANYGSGNDIATAYAVYAATQSLEGDTQNTYGVYVGALQGDTQWAFYNSDEAPSYIPQLFTTIPTEVVTTTKNPSTAESGECYTNTGDADGTAFTLPNDPSIGSKYCFMSTVAQTMTISPNTGETIRYDGSTCATVTLGAAIGESAELRAATGGSGAMWILYMNTGGAVCNA